MSYLRMPVRARARLMAGLLVAGAAVAPALLGTAPALAGACGGPVIAGTNCALTGTFALGTGPMTLTSAGSLSWSGTLNGLNQQLVDTTPGDQGYVVTDASGIGSGWHVTLTATQFTTTGGSPSTLANSGTFSTNGSVSSQSATSGPSVACASGSTCTLPTNSTTYPVAVMTAAASPNAVTIYDTSAGTGSGEVNVGGSSAANPVGWWLSAPANAPAGSYISTITLELIAGP